MAMRLRIFSAFLILLTGVAQTAPAAPPKPGSVVGRKSDKDIDDLADKLRDLLVHNAPDPLIEKSYNWGHTERVARGLKWHDGRPSVQYSDKEDGVWRRVKVVADRLDDNLIFDIRNVRDKEDGRKLFDVYASFDARVFYDQQTWHNGHRLYAGSVRARVRVKVLLGCEVTTRVDFGKSFIPDVVFRLRVRKADLRYDDLVFEHWYGLGGEMAEMMGDAVTSWLREFRPELEQELLSKANAAIVKAGDTREVRLSLNNAFAGKSAAADPAKELLKKARPR